MTAFDGSDDNVGDALKQSAGSVQAPDDLRARVDRKLAARRLRARRRIAAGVAAGLATVVLAVGVVAGGEDDGGTSVQVASPDTEQSAEPSTEPPPLASSPSPETTTAPPVLLPPTIESVGSMRIPAMCDFPAGQLVDGRLQGIPEGQGSLELVLRDEGKVAMGDVTADGVDELAVAVECNHGNGLYPMTVEIFGPGPVRIAEVDLGAVVSLVSRDIVTSVTYSNGTFTVSGKVQAAGDPTCCPTLQVTARVRVQDGKLVIVDVQKSAIPPLAPSPPRRCQTADAGVEVLPVPAGDPSGAVYRVVLTSKAADPCAIDGRPIVSFLDANGMLVDWARRKDPYTAPTDLVLATGERAEALVFRNPGNEDCQVAPEFDNDHHPATAASLNVVVNYSAVLFEGPWVSASVNEPMCHFEFIGAETATFSVSYFEPAG